MTVTITEHRFAVEHRPKGAKRWQVVVTVGSAAVAWQTAFDLMGTRAGDWRVSQVGPAGAFPAAEANR